MRRVRLLAALAVCVALIAVPASAAPAPVGDQLSLLEPCTLGVPIDPHPADTAFHVLHGWRPVPGEQEDIGQYRFDLSIDGVDYKGFLVVEMTGDPGAFEMLRRYLYNFPDGLSAGTYTFHAVWSTPASDPFGGFECTVDVVFE